MAHTESRFMTSAEINKGISYSGQIPMNSFFRREIIDDLESSRESIDDELSSHNILFPHGR